MLKFENVGKIYDDGFEAIKSISFEVPEVEFLVLIGPSGSGKSTTMKMINRLIPHTSGKITIDGEDITKLNAANLRRSIGYVIQHVGLFPHYTIEENISIVPQLLDWDKKKTKARVRELLEMVDLDPDIYSDRYPKELSGGQQQRVGVARALATNPRMVLMDEPFGALDPITREQLQGELISLHRKLKKTFIFVTHDMDEALKLGDRIAIMQDGNLVQLDTPEKILHEPANSFVEEFIGKQRMIQNPELMSIEDVMTKKVVTATLRQSPKNALSLIRQRRIETLIIVDDDHSLVGFVSAYKLVRSMDEITSLEEIRLPPDPLLTTSSNAKDAIIEMAKAPFGIIPVENEAGRLVGIVTRGTLLSALSSQWTEMGVGRNE